jgi:hypothetical protein
VLGLTHNLLYKGYCLYLDSWYTSPNFVDTLCTRKTDVIGTVRIDRKEFPEYVKRARLKKGETVAGFCKKQIIMKWKDKRISYLPAHYTRQGVIQKSSVILDYNKNMVGVEE